MSALRRLEMLAIRAVGRAEIHGDAVLHHAVLLEDLVEHVERPAAVDHEVLRDDLEPVDHGLLSQDVLVVRHAQTDADAVVVEPLNDWRAWSGSNRQRRIGGWDSGSPAKLAPKARTLRATSRGSGPDGCRRSRSRPFLCRSSCLCSRCRRSCNRPCLCRSSALCRS